MTTNRGLHASTHPHSAVLAATRPLARAALSCGVATVLAVGVAGAATAAQQPHDGKGARPAGSAAGAKSDPGRQAAGGDAAPAAASPSPDAATPAPAAKSQAQDKGKSQERARARTRGQDKGQDKGQGNGQGQGNAPAPKPADDPAGNNGTVKVDAAAYDTRVDNEPHASCAFRVTFFGFDEGQTADITVTGIAPTGGGLLLQDKAVPTSDDAAGGAAPDPDGATRVYTLDDLGLGSVAPHPQQGYHVKVAVDSLEAPGGAKQKVLWLEPCEEDAAPVTEPETEPETGGFPPAPGVGGGETPGQPQPGTIGTPVAEGPSPAEAALVEAPASPAAVAAPDLGASVPAGVTSQASALPGALARTGAAGLAVLGLLGAGAAAAGTTLQVARRRLTAGQ